MREASFSLMATGRLGDLAQFAVNPEAHAVVVLVGLEVQVGRACVDRVDQHLLQEAHHGGVFHIRGGVRRFLLRSPGVFGDVEFEVAGGEGTDSCSCALAVCPSSSFSQLVMFDDHPFRVELRGELDALDRLLVGGVGRGDKQAVAAFGQGEHLILRGELVVDDAFGQALHIDGGQVHHRDGQALWRGCGPDRQA
jgi:hypothetical protein